MSFNILIKRFTACAEPVTLCRKTYLNLKGKRFNNFSVCYVSTCNEKLSKYDNLVVHNYLKFLSSLNKTSDSSLNEHLIEHYSYQIDPIRAKLNTFLRKNEDVIELETLLKGNNEDKELKSLVQNETNSLHSEISILKDEILEDLLFPKKLLKQDDVVFEVMSGVGGQESMLFAKEIFDLYLRYFDYKGWNSQIVNEYSTELGGMRHACIVVSGKGTYEQLKFEGGVHRVQRVPKTERSGRLHTSTATVAVYLQPSEVEVILNPKDLKFEAFRSGGKGGQSVNTTDSAVRVIHLPTGITVECQRERSHHRNKEMAIKILRTRIYENETSAIQDRVSSQRKIQIGSASRNEKIRTYNFKDDRITDHRIGKSVYNIESFFEGGYQLEHLIELLIDEYWQECLMDKLEKFKRTS